MRRFSFDLLDSISTAGSQAHFPVSSSITPLAPLVVSILADKAAVSKRIPAMTNRSLPKSIHITFMVLLMLSENH